MNKYLVGVDLEVEAASLEHVTILVNEALQLIHDRQPNNFTRAIVNVYDGDDVEQLFDGWVEEING